MTGIGRRPIALALALITVGAGAFAAMAQDAGMKPGTLRRGADGQLYLDNQMPAGTPSQPGGAAPRAGPAPAVHGSRILAVCKRGCAFSSVADALQDARSGDTVTIAKGIYEESGIIKADRIRVIAEPGAQLSGSAAEGKAAIVVRGDDTLIEGLECSGIEVENKNGACIRLEGRNLILRKVHFHDSEEGILTAPDTGTLTIEDSVLERLGKGGQAHGIYVGNADALIIRRSAILSSQGEGHEVKSRAARTEIEDSVIASLEGVDSRAIDVPNGGQVLIRDTVLEKGRNSSNNEMIGFGLEGVTHETNTLTLERVTAIFDRRNGILVNGQMAFSFIGLKVIGGDRPAIATYPWFPDRPAGAMPPYPQLPTRLTDR